MMARRGGRGRTGDVTVVTVEPLEMQGGVHFKEWGGERI